MLNRVQFHAAVSPHSTWSSLPGVPNPIEVVDPKYILFRASSGIMLKSLPAANGTPLTGIPTEPPI